MKFDVITLFPEMIEKACSYSMPGRAIQNGNTEINTINPRDFAKGVHRKTDDTPYGGGAGMVLMCEPFMKAFRSIQQEENTEVLILTPQGKPYTQKYARELSEKSSIIIICGHYEGFDERIRILTKAKEVSIGDFVLSGGEYASLCIIDSVTRLLSGTLGNKESSEYDTHSEYLLEYPQYTKPAQYEGLNVPEVLTGGNHAKINKYRRIEQFKRTKAKRPDLYKRFLETQLGEADRKILKEIEAE